MTQRQGIVFSRGFLACIGLFVLSESGADPLSHDQAIEIALASTPQMQAQRSAIESAQSQSISVGRLPDPELVIGLENLPVTGPDAYSVEREAMTMRKIGVMQAFPSGSKRASERERAAAVVSLTEQQALQVQLEIARSVSQAWFALYTAETLERTLQLLKRQLALSAQAARAALASGRGTSLEAITAQSALVELEERLLLSRADVRGSRAELESWIGEPAAESLGDAPDIKRLPVARERLLSSMHHHAPVRTLDQQIAVARADVEVARAQKRPDWSTQLAYSKRGDAFSDMVSLEFRVGLPLFGRNRQDPVIRARNADLAQLEAEREAEVRMHAAEITRELATWDSARERLELYERDRVPLARERVRAAQAGYVAGDISLVELLESFTAEVELRSAHAELVNELAQAWAYLRYLDSQEAAR